jgi:hypothetical protein
MKYLILLYGELGKRNIRNPGNIFVELYTLFFIHDAFAYYFVLLFF